MLCTTSPDVADSLELNPVFNSILCQCNPVENNNIAAGRIECAEQSVFVLSSPSKMTCVNLLPMSLLLNEEC